jgi:hypothetical protein
MRYDRARGSLDLHATTSSRLTSRVLPGKWHWLEPLWLAAASCQAELPSPAMRSALAGHAPRSQNKREPPI